MDHRTTFLIIDDNSVDRMIAQTMIKKSLDHWLIDSVEDSSQGIEWIKTNHPNLESDLVILLDMYMPGIDGFGFLELYENLNESFKLNTSIFMLSSAQHDNQKEILSKHKVLNGVLSKPIDIDELVEVIQ